MSPKIQIKMVRQKVIEINKYYPSSQSCNRCGLIHNRDMNASINIMFEALKIYMKSYLI